MTQNKTAKFGCFGVFFGFFKDHESCVSWLVHIPDIGQIVFQIIEQKLVQHCETHIDAQSCKAS